MPEFKSSPAGSLKRRPICVACVMRDINSCPMHCAILTIESRTDTRAKLRAMCRVLRPNAPEISIAALKKFLTSTPQGPDKFATILSQEAKRLLAMDRYERLALFRRKIAILAFDEARRASMLRFGSDNRDCDQATEVGHQ